MNINHKLQIADDISIVVCGEAGQGIQTIERALTCIAKLAGYNVFSTNEFMSRIRGGTNSTEIRISSNRIFSYIDRIDVLIPFNNNAIRHVNKRISEQTLILGEKKKLDTNLDVVDIPFTAIASEVGGKIYANTIATGVALGLLGVKFNLLEEYISTQFALKESKVVQNNIEAGKRGYDLGRGFLEAGKIQLDIIKNDVLKNELLLNGSDTIALGAIAGGCNFVSSYPMSPSTGVLTTLANYSHDFDIIVEQAEDEIAAINMALGAWYAGGRALVTTSGGGFALMSEGISLAGMIETPVVIHLAQRPGPATGLPTRTEQGDIELALYAGHGEFPRFIFAPGSHEQAFYITKKAFNLAGKYQVPVIILTDQYFIDSYYNVPSFDISNIQNDKHIVKTNKNYKRFQLTENGISQRGIPGYGDGIVCVDSDEHTEYGYITEHLDLRTRMVEKRLKKLDCMKSDFIPPELIGKDDYNTLIICWGTNYNAVKEAFEIIGRDDIAILHFTQVYPIHQDVSSYLAKAHKKVIIENNATAQFGKLLKLYTGIDINKRILKYNGLPFSVEEIITGIEGSLE